MTDHLNEEVIGNVSAENEKKHALILIIDPSENSRNMLKRRLSTYGHEVIVCESSADARKILKSRKVDVIFLEFVMKDISGYDFLKFIKSNRECVNIPVIVVSSENDVDKVVQCIEAGAEDFLVKPLNPTILKARLSNSIAKKEAHDKEVHYIAEMKEKQRQVISQEKMTSLGNMATAVSEELKNPLNIVINLSEVSRELCNEIYEKIKHAFDELPELKDLLFSLKKDVEKVSEQGRKADKILRFMIDQSRAMKTEFYAADINKIVEETIRMVISDYKSSNKQIKAKISMKLDNRIPSNLIMSPQALNQALYNMLDNSIYSVNQKSTNDDLLINISTKEYDDYVEITIYDNGCGIEKSLTRMIFEPFFTTRSDGQGLGLSAVNQSIVQMHNGSIKVKSEAEKFAEFIIKIPKIFDDKGI